jgi:dTDP-4-dehydrorhamnose reductase
MRVMITGAKGMLGNDLLQQLSKHHEVHGFDINDIDITRKEVAGFISEREPEFVFHLASYTDVDGAEEDAERAHMVNVVGTGNVAHACKVVDIPLLFASTDYVFDGMKSGAYVEEDEPHPINVYGKTKHEAEKVITETLDKWFIVRTSWLFGIHGKNFVDTIQRLAMEKNHLEVVDDQRGAPTYTRDLARALELFIGASGYGIYHVANKGSCTWFDFAREIIFLTGSTAEVHPVPTEKVKRKAKRPSNSVLDTERFEAVFDYRMPTWQNGLKRYLEEQRISKGRD